MKKTLVIGSTVVDVLLRIPALPGRGEDINITSSEYRIGGCAYNVYKTLKSFKSPALLCSPVGTGAYGSIVKEHFVKEKIDSAINLDEENGCCYCLIEPDGERSFLSHHGAEYLFSRSWMRHIDFSDIDSVFFCGLELEESSGMEIVEFIYELQGLELFFAPGPRIMHIPHTRMEMILLHRDEKGRGPLLHLNEKEALNFSGKQGIEEASQYLADKTDNSVVITRGEKGCYCFSKDGGAYVSGFPSKVLDTVGAGDVHCGAIIACLKNGIGLPEACVLANRAGAAAVGINFAVPEELSQLYEIK